MRLFFIFCTSLFFIISCVTAPKIYLKTDNAVYWKELIRNKVASDNYQNIYRFDEKANMNLTIYGYKSKIKYTLFLMKERNQAFYYKNSNLKSYIIESMPSFNLYKDAMAKDNYNILYVNPYFNKNFKNRTIYLPIGLMVDENKLYIAKIYDAGYNDRLNYWLRKNGYGDREEWRPAINVDWSSYPVPTEHEIDWEKIELIGILF